MDQCDACEALLELYQLSGELLQRVCPQQQVRPLEVSAECSCRGVPGAAGMWGSWGIVFGLVLFVFISWTSE